PIQEVRKLLQASQLVERGNPKSDLWNPHPLRSRVGRMSTSYSPDFNPIELWWSQLKYFSRSFAPITTQMVDKLISVALDLINPQHLRNWFASCCYCTS
ncbi:MAG: hypothetical protein ACYT04_32475, partial [Nostoc sp.]